MTAQKCARRVLVYPDHPVRRASLRLRFAVLGAIALLMIGTSAIVAATA